jgi:hypothetical protein
LPTVGEHYFGLFNPFECSPLLLTSHPVFQQFSYTSLYPLPSHLVVCNITDALSFSFPFLLFLRSTEQFHSYKHVLLLSVYMISLFLCICLSLDLSSTYERKHEAFVFLSLAHSMWHDVFQLEQQCGWKVNGCNWDFHNNSWMHKRGIQRATGQRAGISPSAHSSHSPTRFHHPVTTHTWPRQWLLVSAIGDCHQILLWSTSAPTHN